MISELAKQVRKNEVKDRVRFPHYHWI